jgi:hypothetical protein
LSVSAGWLKFAILGSTYARALENAATRGGRALTPALQAKVTQLHAQPQAKLQRGLGDMYREHARGGELTPTPQQRNMQDMMAHVPWAGAEHVGNQHGNPFAEHALNAQLKQRGLDYNTPAGQPNVHQRIQQSFGPPPTLRRGTQVGHASGDQTHVDSRRDIQGRMGQNTFGGSMLDIFDGPQGHREHLPELTRHGVGARQAPMAQPAAINRPALPHVARGQPVGAAGMTGPSNRGEATSVLKVANLPLAAGIGIPLAVGGGILASKPGIRADLADRFGNPGDIHQKDMTQEIPEVVQGQASRAAQALAARGIDPTHLRIAVDAPSGAGKTVLSKALASQMGLRHHGLDWRPNLRFHQLMGGGDIEKTPYAPHAGEILEHQQLLRSYDPELFDVAIHIHKDPQTIRQQVLKRGRGARTHDLLDYEKSIGVGRKAFETLGGEAIDLGDGVMMKVRPQGGWGNALDEQLMQMGIDPTGLTRHQKLLSLHSGQRTDSGAGWTPYMKSPFTGGETAAIAASVPLGVMAAKALARRPV